MANPAIFSTSMKSTTNSSLRRCTFAGELPENSQSASCNFGIRNKYGKLLGYIPSNSSIHTEWNKTDLSTPLRTKQSRRNIIQNANFSLPNLKKRKSRLRDSISNPTASKVLAAVQSCSTLDLPWSKLDRVYLPQLVWPDELFTKAEANGLEWEAIEMGREFELKYKKL